MKTRDFSNSLAPVLRNPGGNIHVAPPLTGGAQQIRPLGHGGAQPNPAPGADEQATSSSVHPLTTLAGNQTPATTPAAPPFDVELDSLLASMAEMFKGVNRPTYAERLTGVTCAVLKSPACIETLLAERVDDEERLGKPGVHQHARMPLSSYLVGFANEVLVRVDMLAEANENARMPPMGDDPEVDREAPTQP